MFFTLEIQEIRRSDRLYRLPVRHFTTIREIKQQLKASFLPFPLDRMALFHSSRSEALPNQTTLHEIGIDREGFALSLSLTLSSSPQFLLEPLKTCPLDAPTRDLLTSVRLGLKAGHPPGKTDLLDSTGGVYFLKGATGSSAAVFKPHDEEQGMPNNPKGHAGNGKEGVGLRPFFKPGEGYLREAAAYLLDSRHFAGVPPTTVAHCQHPAFHYPNATSSSSSTKGGLYPKLGSLQQFVKAADTFEDISSSLIGTLELQKIALFDMRVLNNDRNSANLLAIRKDIDQVSFASNRPRRDSRSGSMTSNGEDEYDEIDMSDFVDRPWKKSSSRNDDCYELIPIDHGYCLPTKLLIEEFDWVWFYCPQISQPVAPEIKKYMNELNIDELIDTLRRQIGISEDALFLLRVTHNLILQGINQGLTLRDIAALIARTEDGVPSPLEKAVKSAEENAQRAVEAHGGFFSLPSPPRNARGKSPNSVNNIVNTILPSLATRDQRPPSHNLPSSSNDNDVSLLTPLSQKVVNQQSLPVFNGSYLRPRGPLTFLQSFEPSALSPQSQKDISFSNDSFFLRNFSPEYDTTESSSDSSAELLTSIAMNNKAPMMDSSGHDDQSTEHFESSLDREDEGKELLGVDLDEPFDLPRNAGPSFRRVSSFSNLEVQTTEPLVFEKTISKSQSGSSSTGRPPNKDRHSSGCTSEEEMELENGSTSVSPSSEIISELPKINIPAPGYGLTRVVSFNAFESAPLYEPDRSDRHFNRLKRERRKLSAKSPEFQELRMNFANEAILKTLASHFKTK